MKKPTTRLKKGNDLQFRRRIEPAESSFWIRIGRSAIHGCGLFAANVIPPNRKVIEYKGRRLGITQANQERRKRIAAGTFRRISAFSLSRYWIIDGDLGGNGAVLINHSCDPNLHVRRIRGHILFFSRRRIRVDEELLIDYRFRWCRQLTTCLCGSTNCRGTINMPQGWRFKHKN